MNSFAVQGNTIVTVVLLAVLLWYPDILSETGIGIVIAWVYGVLFSRFLSLIFQYAVFRWGVNRNGIRVLGVVLVAGGVGMMYLAYTQTNWVLLGLGWVAVYAGLYSAMAAHKKRLGNSYYEMFTTMQYLVVALMTLVLFGPYIAQTPLGGLGIVYQGLRGESLVTIALVMLVCEITHVYARQAQIKIEKVLNR